MLRKNQLVDTMLRKTLDLKAVERHKKTNTCNEWPFVNEMSYKITSVSRNQHK
jgi:hypothetical protein